jgi:hypothetical protein
VETDFDRALREVTVRLGQVTLGVESAASYLGISPTFGLPLTLLSVTPLDVQGLNATVVIVPDINLANALIDGQVKITSIEQTIIDLIRFDRDPQTITESMCYYYYSHGEEESWEDLPNLSESYGVLKELESYYEDAIDHALH